jgi:fibronectin-binding autotransporter adhesin
MTVKSSGSLAFSEIQTEFTGSNPISLSEYYAGGSYVPAGSTGINGAIPSSGTISVSKFYGSTRFTPFSQGPFTTAGSSGSVTIPVGASTVTLTIVGAGGIGASPANYPQIDFYAGGGGGGGGGTIVWTISVAGYAGETMSYYVGDGGYGQVDGAATKNSYVTWQSLSPTAFGGRDGTAPQGNYGNESPGVGGAGGQTGGNGLFNPITRNNGSDGGNGGYFSDGFGGPPNGGEWNGSSGAGGSGSVRFDWAL